MPRYVNSFSSPTHIEEVILDNNGATIGTIRIKPSRAGGSAYKQVIVSFANSVPINRTGVLFGVRVCQDALAR